MPKLDLVRRGARRLPATEAAALRLAARLAYLHEGAAPSLQELAQREEFARAGLPRLAEWATEEDWDGQRALERGRRRERAQEAADRAYRKTHAHRLRQLDALHDEAARWRSHPRLQPKSWEAVAAVQLRAAQLAQQMSAPPQAEAALPPVRSPQAEVDETELGTIAPDEAWEAAHHILRRRRAQVAEAGSSAPLPLVGDAGAI